MAEEDIFISGRTGKECGGGGNTYILKRAAGKGMAEEEQHIYQGRAGAGTAGVAEDGRGHGRGRRQRGTSFVFNCF